MDDIKVCPFCGEDASLCTVVMRQHEIAYVVKCDNLDCIMSAGGTVRQTISQAINAWNARTIDVPIVRCGECIHRRKPLYPHPSLVWCPLIEHHHHPDWFCAYGKKEEK